MQIELKVNCTCNCKPMDRTPPKYNTDIIAPACFWQEAGEDYTLQLCPVPGQSYGVKLYPPLSIALYEKLWLYYESPLAYYNDFENAGDIAGTRFCYGQITAIHETIDNIATIEFNVEKSLSYSDIVNSCPEVSYPKEWLGGFIGNHNAWVEKHAPYYLIKSNAQGDLGQTVVALEHNDEIYVLSMYDWGFHRSEYYAGKYLIDKEFKKYILEKCE